MSELSKGASALVRAGRTAFRPEASDRERVLQSLKRTLGDSALLDAAQPAERTMSPSGGRFPLWGRVVGGLGALAVGAAVFVGPHVWTKTTPSPELPPVASAAQPEAVSPTPTDGEQAKVPLATRNVREAPTPNTQASPMRRPASDSLAEEVSLVSKAEQRLYAGYADDALKILAEHERRFPNGTLAEQRMAARVQSLCTLGRIAEAKIDLAKLARAYPLSPQLDRGRKLCGIDAP
jgi:hypothetical protein